MVVIGQGYVGLPLAVRAAEQGYDVVGFDLDEARIEQLAAGHSFVEDIPDERLAGRARHAAATTPAPTPPTSPASTSP